VINLHLNGDIVRCADMSTIQEQLKTRRKKENKCCYGVCMHSCETWKNYNKEKLLCSSNKWNETKYVKSICQPCTLKKDIICPLHKVRVDTGKMEKTFKINNQEYRKLASGAAYMTKNTPKNEKAIFFTLTFPQFKRETNENEVNECFSRFMENLHNTYGVKYYVAVREYGEKTFRVHFHCLVCMRFTSFTILNDAWNHSIKDLCYYSKNAFTTRKKTVVLYNPGSALRYCCKYFSKQRGTRSNSRLVFLASPLLIKPIKKYGVNSLEILRATQLKYKSLKFYPSKYVTIFRITDPYEFDDFCKIYLYSLFGIDQGKTDFEARIGAIGIEKN
jgi:hypothetical protein